MNRIHNQFLAGILLAMGLQASGGYAQTFTFSTIAGGTEGSDDGNNSAAQFWNPTGVAVDGEGNVYVADQHNNAIREITPSGTNWIVTTIAGGTRGALDGTNTGAQFSDPTGIVLDSATNLYVADQFNYTIRKISPVGTNWVTSTIAGQAGVPGAGNGTNTGAQFHNPVGITMDNAGNLFVADEYNNAIRELSPFGTNWIVSTIAGGSQGTADGTNAAAQFYLPAGVAVDTNDRVFVADQFNNTIRLVTPSGTNWVVTTIAGQTNSGSSNGVGTNALFDLPLGVALDSNNNVYVADSGNNAIREMRPSSTNWNVTTIGGGALGSSNGTGTDAQFYLPFSVAADMYGDIFVADSGNNAIRFGLSSSNAPQTGSLQVTLTPTNAVAAGAEWQLQGQSFQASGAILSGLTPGSYTIAFSNVSGFTTPADQNVIVTANQTTTTTGNYTTAIVSAGSLQVLISPAGAVAAGAQWQVDDGPFQTNEAVVAGLSVGSHILSFNTIPGWTTPGSQIVTISNSQTTLGLGTYGIPISDSLQVTILPPAVVTAGAEWQVDGGAWQDTGTIVSNLSPGFHVVTFTNVFGWATPSNQTVSISTNGTATATGIYTNYTLQVTILPTNVVTAGAEWQVDGGAWQDTGTIVSNLSQGFHMVTFTNVFGWATPSNQSVFISSTKATATATGIYVALPNYTITVNALPGADGMVSGSGTFPEGALLSITAVANSNFEFVAWIGDATGTSNPLAITVNTNLNITAYFAAIGSNTLTIITNGEGKVSPNPTGKELKLGQHYSLKATAQSQNVFSNWTGSITTDKNPLAVKVTSNMVLQANFIPNPFLPFVGTYNGLFVMTNGVTEQTAGMLKGLHVASSGMYSSSVLIDGTSHLISGAFDLGGMASKSITVRANPVQVNMALNMNNSFPQVTGTVSGTNMGVPWVADLVADLASNSLAPSEYTMLIPPNTNNASSPGGDGYASITNNHAGTVTITGALADGTSFSQTVPIAPDGYVPIYTTLYNGTGLLMGWINLGLSNLTGVSLTWIHPARSVGLYRTAFTNVLFTNQIQLSPWTNSPASMGALANLTSLSFLDNLSESNTPIPIIVDSGIILGPELNGAINPKTGLLKLTIGNGPTPTTGHGAILLNAIYGGGYLLTTTNSQAIELEP